MMSDVGRTDVLQAQLLPVLMHENWGRGIMHLNKSDQILILSSKRRNSHLHIGLLRVHKLLDDLA